MFFDLWPTRSNGMGEVATDWDILEPYGRAKALDDEDLDILAAMCRAYLIAKKEGVHPLAIAPVDAA